MTKKLTLALAAAGAALFASAQAATLVVEDVVDTVDGVPQIDFVSFTLTDEGEVTLTVDAQGAGFMDSDLDAFLFVAVDDGERTLDDFLVDSDDDGPGTDSVITVTLPAGTYLAGVSNCCISADEFVAGENGSIGVTFTDGAYRLTIDSEFLLDADAVPLPGAAALFVPAILGGMAARRRRGASVSSS